jgi:hypothetical protein
LDAVVRGRRQGGIFTILYQLIGIGILVEILRRLGLSFVEVRRLESQPDQRSS